MRLTVALKAWLEKHCEVSSGASDDEYKEAAAKALISGTLSQEKLAELSVDPKAEQAGQLMTKLDSAISAISTLAESMAEEKKKVSPDGKEPEKKEPEKASEEKTKDKVPERKEPSAMSKAFASMSTPGGVEEGGKDIEVRVKEAAESYGTEKRTLLYPKRTKGGQPHSFAGQPVMDYVVGGRVMETSSERDKAIIGAWAAYQCAIALKGGSKTLAWQGLPQHHKELVMHALHNERWGGASDGGNFADICNRKLTPREIKALIDDAVSGGIEAAPIVFDSEVIQAPLLNGELYPLTNRISLDRGRRVEGISVGTVTSSWGGIDDTAIALFNTASYVSEFNTTIHRWQGAVRVGLDFLSDTPIDFGAIFTAQYGERLLEDLDDVIADGNGTSQPEGVMQKSGIGTSAWGGATSLGNYESLRFGVAKQEHGPGVAASAVFCGNETSYQRARAIPVGASDARRLGGMNYDSYSWMERPYKINATLGNTEIFYAILARYRMFVRRGLTIRTSTEGDTLIRNNEMLISVTARYGGQLERAACGAITTTAPA
jgi:HK97 family phage major capsid protein